MPRLFFIVPLVALALAACTEATPTEATPTAVVAAPAFRALTGGTPNTNAANGLANANSLAAPRRCRDGLSFGEISAPDAKLIAPLNTKDNAALFASTNGSCTGNVVDNPTVWNDPTDRCQTDYPTPRSRVYLKALYPDVPEDWYFCARPS
jgi:hypothetical protein